MPIPLAKLVKIGEELIGAGYSASKASKYKTVASKYMNAVGSPKERYYAANELTARYGDAADLNGAAKEIYEHAANYQKTSDFPGA